MTSPKSFDLGGVRVTLVSGGINRIDGGTMMGILPKFAWNAWYPADKANRITLDTNCLVVETEDETLLFETGTGDKLTDKEAFFFGATKGDWIRPNLEAAGFAAEGIDKVVLTHLHTDHSGGALTLDEHGEPTPTFPNAMVYIGDEELDDAKNGRGITPNAYDSINWEALEDRGLLEPMEAGAAITDRVRYLITPGHTRFHQSILVKGSERTLFFAGDVLPLARHAVPHFNMSFDVDPVGKTEMKKVLLENAVENNWLLVLAHEPGGDFWEVVKNERRDRLDLTRVRPEDNDG